MRPSPPHPKKTHGLKRGGRRRPVLCGSQRRFTRRPRLASVSSWVFSAATFRGWSPRLRNFSLRRCRSVYNSALARGEERLWGSSHALEPGVMYTTIVSVYTTASVFSNPARGPTVFSRSCCFIVRSPKKGNEIQRCWRLYELSCCASDGPDLLIRHASMISFS